jgi:hypothetical protein
LNLRMAEPRTPRSTRRTVLHVVLGILSAAISAVLAIAVNVATGSSADGLGPFAFVDEHPFATTAFATFLTVILAAASWYIQSETRTRTPITTIEQRIEELSTNLHLSAHIVEEVEAELKLRSAALEQLKEESEANRRIAELNAEQAAAVNALVKSTLTLAQEEGRRRSRWVDILIFIAGLVSSVPLNILASFIYDNYLR